MEIPAPRAYAKRRRASSDGELEQDKGMSAKDRLFDEIQSEVTGNVADATLDRPRRKRLLRSLESQAGDRRVCMYYSQRTKSLSQYDITPFYSMLKSIGDVDNLDLIIVSPGGDGAAAESLLDLCRKFCKRQLRVVVPVYAKSAATLIALGADEIVMGETSELGPIDAQVFVLQDGQEQQVSADHFLRARDEAIRALGSGEQALITAAHIQLSQLGPAFLQQCSDLMQFSKDFAGKQLRANMFKAEHLANAAECGTIIRNIVENLTSSSKRLLHGRMITAEDILDDPDLQRLKIVRLGRSDEYWKALNELMLRTEFVAQSNDVGKMLFAWDFQLLAN